MDEQTREQEAASALLLDDVVKTYGTIRAVDGVTHHGGGSSDGRGVVPQEVDPAASSSAFILARRASSTAYSASSIAAYA